MKKPVLGILTLALLAGVIYQLHAKSQSHSAAEPTATAAREGAQQTPSAAQTSAPVANEKVKAVVLGQVSNQELTPEFIAELQAKMTSGELEQLALTARDESQPQETRRRSLYILTKMGSTALPALTVVATTPMPVAASQDPHSVAQIKQSFEAGLRVTAIEALDDLGTDPRLSPAIKDSMLKILKVQKHRSLTLLAQISLSGIESGRPGKVKRAVDDLLKEKE